MNKKDRGALLAGIVSIFLMGTVPAMRRHISESLSTYTSGAISCLLSGIIILMINIKRTGIASIREIDNSYWLGCAIPFFVYNCTSYMATGLAATREGSILAGLFTQLWPLGGLVFTLIILGHKTDKRFWFCCMIGIFGVFFSTLFGSSLPIRDTLSQNGIAIISGMVDPIFYGIYSGYYCRLVKDSRHDWHPILTLFLGVGMTILAIMNKETITELSVPVIMSILFQVIFSGVIATELFKYALRSKQRINTLLLSNFTPIVSTLFSAVFLNVKIKWPVLAGSAMIVLSVILAKKSIKE